jgi:Homeodomain-like domain
LDDNPCRKPVSHTDRGNPSHDARGLHFGLVTTLDERAEAALRVLGDDPGVDRLLLLEQVVWPTPRVAEAVPVVVGPLTPGEIEEMAELKAQGWTHWRIAERHKRSRATVSDALRRRCSGVKNGC